MYQVHVTTTGRKQGFHCTNKMSTAALDDIDAEYAFDPTKSVWQRIWHATAAHWGLKAHTSQSAIVTVQAEASI